MAEGVLGVEVGEVNGVDGVGGVGAVDEVSGRMGSRSGVDAEVTVGGLRVLAHARQGRTRR
ncbi:hypothetical protein ACIQUC_15190 [Curtobacterium sp. NPDC098951]|uniref:hypothetical protein n=1 Tax=Curtobacterium sp. NPDC098951 TaxID=3363974 RepID=UPI0038082A43